MEITVDDVIDTITSQHTLTPSGFIDQRPARIQRAGAERGAHGEGIREPDHHPARRRRRSGSPSRLGDVAKVEEGLADVRRISRFNGVPSVGLGIIKQRGSNAVAVGR